MHHKNLFDSSNSSAVMELHLPYPSTTKKSDTTGIPSFAGINDVVKCIFAWLKAMNGMFGIRDRLVDNESLAKYTDTRLTKLSFIRSCKDYGFFDLSKFATTSPVDLINDVAVNITFTIHMMLFAKLTFKTKNYENENEHDFQRRVNTFLESSLFPFEFKLLCKWYAFLPLKESSPDEDVILAYFLDDAAKSEHAAGNDKINKHKQEMIVKWAALYHISVQTANTYSIPCINDAAGIENCKAILNGHPGFQEVYREVSRMYTHFFKTTRKYINGEKGTAEDWKRMDRNAQITLVQEAIKTYIEMEVIPKIETYQIGALATPFLFEYYKTAPQDAKEWNDESKNKLVELLHKAISPNCQLRPDIFEFFSKIIEAISLNQEIIEYDPIDKLKNVYVEKKNALLIATQEYNNAFLQFKTLIDTIRKHAENGKDVSKTNANMVIPIRSLDTLTNPYKKSMPKDTPQEPSSNQITSLGFPTDYKSYSNITKKTIDKIWYIHSNLNKPVLQATSDFEEAKNILIKSIKANWKQTNDVDTTNDDAIISSIDPLIQRHKDINTRNKAKLDSILSTTDSLNPLALNYHKRILDITPYYVKPYLLPMQGLVDSALMKNKAEKRIVLSSIDTTLREYTEMYLVNLRFTNAVNNTKLLKKMLTNEVQWKIFTDSNAKLEKVANIDVQLKKLANMDGQLKKSVEPLTNSQRPPSLNQSLAIITEHIANCVAILNKLIPTTNDAQQAPTPDAQQPQDDLDLSSLKQHIDGALLALGYIVQ
jgi:hypothetical protein